MKHSYDFETEYGDSRRSFHIKASDRMFSPRFPDKGTAAMLAVCPFGPADNILDLGCGTGIVGLSAITAGARATMCDIDPEAVRFAVENAKNNLSEAELTRLACVVSDGFDNVPDRTFTKILSNPPYHTDFSIAKKFIEGAFDHLVLGGELYMVTKRLDWYRNKIVSVFGGVRITESDGYYVFRAEKRDEARRRHEIRHRKGGK
jgi:16S rRNA (guanine1207-N2)-methyltransferase